MKCLYRCFSADDRLLFVGVTSNRRATELWLWNRDWAADLDRIEYEEVRHPYRAKAAAIRDERPEHNVAGRTKPEPESWEVAPPALPPAFSGRAAFTVSETAEMLGITRQHLYSLVAKGSVRSVKLGSCRRIAASEVQRLLSDGAL